MKGIIRLLFWVVALTTFCGTVSAQTGKQRLTREQLAEVQAKHIAMGTRSASETAAQPNDR